MNCKTLKLIAKQMYNLDLSEIQIKKCITEWEQSVPDVKAYRDWVSKRGVA
jgi:hypothetical protein